MKMAYLSLACLICLRMQAQQHGVYTNLKTALQQPGKVRVLDLRGQHLSRLPDSLIALRNVEAILIGMKLRNLLFYPPAWKYELHLKHLPAGGYLHKQGRGGGPFYSFNNLKAGLLDFCQFPALRVLYIDGGMSFATTDTVATHMAKCRPQVIVLGGEVKGTDTDYTVLIHKWKEAELYLRPFKIKRF